MSKFTIRPYARSREDAAKLAVMWNESDDQWPGTFSGGVPFDTERVYEWMARESGLAVLVVDDPVRERIVGYGSLWQEHDKERTCYVPLLNVHPDYQGKSLARRILTRMVDRATELGYHLMTIGTWSGNLKSVPLYKKVGFFWVPDTSVFMENFVPLIRQMGVAQAYFQKHDWYTTFRRELRQVEDEQRHRGMKVYTYRWQEGDDSLTVLIDRQSKAPTGVETPRLAAYAELGEIEPAHGLTYPIRWRVLNKGVEPVDVSILASGDPGIDVLGQHTFRLRGGQEQLVEGRFSVSPDVEPVKQDWPAPGVKTVLVVGGDVIELSSGLRPRPAVEVNLEPVYPVLLPGRPQRLHVQLRNNLDRPLGGVVSLTPQIGLEGDWPELRHDFELKAQGYARLPLTVTCDRPGALPLRFNTLLETDEGTADSDQPRQVRGRPQRIPLFSLPPGGVTADVGPGDEGEIILIQNEFFRLRCQPEGGRCAVWHRGLERPLVSVREVLGPPFVPSELWYKTYDLSLEREHGRVKGVLRARSHNYPGLTLIKEVIVSASPLLRLRYRLVNEGTQPHTCQLNPRLWFGERERARLSLPRAERLVHARAEIFSSSHGDVPEEPEGMAERWLAWRVEDMVVGLMWDETVEKHQWEWSWMRLDRPAQTLEPGTTLETPPAYLYAGPGDWSQVQRTWRRLAGQSSPPSQPAAKPGGELEFGFEPSPILGLGNQVEASLRVETVRELPLAGRVRIDPPPGWEAEPSELDLEEVKQGQPLLAPVRLSAPTAQVGPFEGRLVLEGNRFDARQPFSLIRLGDEREPVQVRQETEAERTIWVIDNGYSRWHLAPAYHGGGVGWYTDESPVNHLYSPFPEADGGSMGWLKPWYGGLRPLLNASDYDDKGWPGKLHEEKFAAQVCERRDARGLVWRGTRLSVDVQRQAFRGLRVEIDYLTVGRSNLLKMVYRSINRTDVYRRVSPGVFVFCQVGGRWDNGTLFGDGVQLKRNSVMVWPAVGRWGAVSNPDSGRTLVMVAQSPQAWLSLSDWGQDGGHLLGQAHLVLAPNGCEKLVFYLALADSADAARHYAALAQ